MGLALDDQMTYARAISVHWHTHFPEKSIGDMTLTQFDAAIDAADTALTDWKTKSAEATKAEGPRDTTQTDIETKCQSYRDGVTALIGRGDSPARRSLPQEDDYRTAHRSQGGSSANVPAPKTTASQ